MKLSIIFILLLAVLLPAPAFAQCPSQCVRRKLKCPSSCRRVRDCKITFTRRRCTRVRGKRRCSNVKSTRRGYRCRSRSTRPPPSSGRCRDVCLRWWSQARSGCNLSNCVVKACPTSRGFICTSRTASPPKPPPATGGCAGTCVRWWSQARKGCNLSVCKVTPCSGGFTCVSKVSVANPPTPTVPKATCGNVCIEAGSAVVQAGCNLAKCSVTPCRTTVTGSNGYGCVDKSRVKPPPPPVVEPPPVQGCGNVCIPGSEAGVRASCDVGKCAVVACKENQSGQEGYGCVDKSRVKPAAPAPAPPVAGTCAGICETGVTWTAATAACDSGACSVVKCRPPGGSADGWGCVKKSVAAAAPVGCRGVCEPVTLAAMTSQCGTGCKVVACVAADTKVRGHGCVKSA